MALTAAQVAQYGATIKQNITASPDLNGKQDTEIAALYNLAASPAFWVWRTSVSRSNIYNDASPDATTWDWTIYKGQGVAEQNAWVQMFMGDQADFSKANLRGGISKIFGAANANTTHCLAIGRRQSNRIEKLLASGAGSTASPATMGFEGSISAQNVSDILSQF